MKLVSGKVLLALLSALGLVMSDDPLTPKGKGEQVVCKVASMIEGSGIFPNDNAFLCRVAWVESKYGTDSRTYRPNYYGGIWQVDEIAFNDTKDRISKEYSEAILRAFGIDWANTSWEDLEKPLYSALAARLYLALVPEAIPSYCDLGAQGRYWKKHYNRSGEGTPKKFVDDVRQAKGCVK